MNVQLSPVRMEELVWMVLLVTLVSVPRNGLVSTLLNAVNKFWFFFVPYTALKSTFYVVKSLWF